MNSINPTKIVYSDTLDADIYTPIMKVATKEYPCVIFVSGFASINFRLIQAYKDWAKLMAANGIIGIVYEANSPSADFDKLTEHLTTNAKKLHLDKNNIGVWSASGNSLLALNKVNASSQFKCHAIYYGLTTTINSQYLDEVKEMSSKNGFAFFVEGEYLSRVPTLIVRAGKDRWTTILNSIDEFVRLSLTRNNPFELVNYPEGQHAFDMLDNNETSKRIIVETVGFFKREFKR
jgi:dienelactone hydrolase